MIDTYVGSYKDSETSFTSVKFVFLVQKDQGLSCTNELRQLFDWVFILWQKSIIKHSGYTLLITAVGFGPCLSSLFVFFPATTYGDPCNASDNVSSALYFKEKQ